ncbi:MAG: hypothetical protein IT473_15775 [Lysobacter sp.]|nr:hypothetical protein [Lysobacter sp.]
MPLIIDSESPISTRIWNVLRALNIITREQLVAAYEDGTLAREGLGPKSMAELRRALGLTASPRLTDDAA